MKGKPTIFAASNARKDSSGMHPNLLSEIHRLICLQTWKKKKTKAG